jgi:hypothetical protein
MFSRLIESWKNSLSKNRDKIISQRSKEAFQIKEVSGELWFTHYGEPFCPCSMMKDEPISVLKTLRQLYVSLYK